MKTIKVTGEGTAKLRPDLAIGSLDFAAAYATKEACTKRAKYDLISVYKTLESCGLDPETLKTKSFNISPFKEDYKDPKTGETKRRLVGYKYYQTLEFSFENNNELITKVMDTCSTLKMDSDLKLHFTFSDKKKGTEMALKDAINDAYHKANFICENTNQTLGEIVNILYGAESECYGMSRMDGFYECGCDLGGAEILELNPNDIKFEDRVVVVFEIK